MRMQVTLHVERETTISLNYQHALSSVVYRVLERADAKYARFLHHRGYALPESPGDTRRFKGFVFSDLFPQRSCSRDARRGLLHLLPGLMRWYIASPLDNFGCAFASGLLQSEEVRLGESRFSLEGVETLPTPELSGTTKFRCLSPIVASLNQGDHSACRYLRPTDSEMSERLRQNLIHKHHALFGRAPGDDKLSIEWDAGYLHSHRHEKHPGTKLKAYKDIRIVGVVCPFAMTGSLELMRLACDAGLGEKNAAGFGFVEVAR